MEEVKSSIGTLANYINEAIANQKAGKEILHEQNKQALVIPQELIDALGQDSLTIAFAALSLGKQREFVEYISTAKRQETKTARLEKILPMIKHGTGLNDKYGK